MNHQKDCQDRREAIVALVLGELEAPAVDELKQHLETCPACREFYQELTTEEEMIISGFGTLADRVGAHEDRLIKQLEEQSQSEKPITSGPAFGGRLWKGIKTMPKISKIAASIIVALGVIGVIALFTHTGSNLAFADVLSHVQQSDYTFMMSMASPEEGAPANRIPIKFHSSGKMRMDYEVGGIFGRVSSIADIKQRKTLMIFHRQKAAQFLGDGRDLSTRLSNPFGFLTESPQNLWNLRDGTEERLENRQIDSQSAEGFRVRLQGEVEGIEFRQEITIWAQARTGVPLLVEILVTSTTDPEQTVKITLSDFNINVELDDSLFNMEPPTDYILRYSKSLDEVLAGKAATEPTPTGRQVEQALDLWERGQQDQAAEIMLQIDWTGPVSFSMHLYNFTLTEKEYITLTLEDGEQASREFIALNSRCRALTRHLVSLGQNDKDQGETDKAERFFRTVYRFGMLIKGNEETLINTRMVGYAVTISGLRELTALYGETGDQEKLDWARQENQKVDAARIKYRDSIR